jgi:NADPH-dependent glutamate synthase beta subunit-like oxidoreductase/ferredoxin
VQNGPTCLSFPHFRNLTRDAISIKQPMSIERATSDLPAKYAPPGPESVGGMASPPPSTAATYPAAPSQAACAALVPCRHGAQGCPVGVDIPALTRAVAGGDHEAAFRVVRAAHPLPSTCGNGCSAPCESACRRRPFGAPVAIGALEEHAATFAMPDLVAPGGPCTSRFEARSVAGAVGRSIQAAGAAARSGKIVAVIGAGPAGLACAHDLTLLGHRAVVVEARAQPGGLLTSGIPSFRFPVVSAQVECAAVLALGVEFRGMTSRDELRSLLASGVDGIFLAIGASHAGLTLLEAHQQHPDIFDAMDVLETAVPPLGRTIVAGEGSLAIDAARVLVRRAAADANAPPVLELVLTSPLTSVDATPELLASCAREGIRIHHEWRVRGVEIDAASGLLASIEIAAPDGASARVLPCDRLVLAPPRAPKVGRLRDELELTRNGFIATDPQTLRTSMPNVWAGGACAFGHRSIAHAVADGKRAAWEIHAALTGTRVFTTFASAWVDANGRPRPDRGAAERRRALPLLDAPPSEPFAAVSPRAATRAGEEAARCFDCARLPVVTGECTGCGRCAESCPTGAITLEDARPTVDAEICNRCGVCVDQCPEGVLTMLRAEWEERVRFDAVSPQGASLSPGSESRSIERSPSS